MLALTKDFLLLLAIFLTDVLVSAQNISYVTSPHFNYLFTYGKAVRSRDAKHILTKDVSNCTCKQACFATNCMAWSVVSPENGLSECRLDTEGPTKRTLENNSDATYFFREDSIPGKYYFASDNLLYLYMKFTMTFYTGRDKCSSIPGHRLVIIRTLMQLEDIRKRYNNYYLVLNLEKRLHSPNNIGVLNTDKCDSSTHFNFDIVWGDGTRYMDTGLPKTIFCHRGGDRYIYSMVHGTIYDRDPDEYHLILCQANPLGVEW